MSQVNHVTGATQLPSYSTTGKIFDSNSTDFYQLLLGNSITPASEAAHRDKTKSQSIPTSFSLNKRLENYALREGIETPSIKDFLGMQSMQRSFSPESRLCPITTNENIKTVMTCSPEHRRGILRYIDMALMTMPPKDHATS